MPYIKNDAKYISYVCTYHIATYVAPMMFAKGFINYTHMYAHLAICVKSKYVSVLCVHVCVCVLNSQKSC